MDNECRSWEDLPNIRRTLYALHPDVVCGITQVDDRVARGAEQQALAQTYACATNAVRMLTQVHGVDVINADVATHGMQGDALIARAGGILLTVRVADCCPIMIYDPPTQAMAAIHSGWRGTAQNIVAATVRALTQTYGALPSTMRVLVGPCAGGDRYVVRSDVATVFPLDVVDIGQDQFLFSNRSAVARQLVDVGINPMHITHDSSCTIADARYHSYRRDGQRAGRSVAFVGRINTSVGTNSDHELFSP